MAYAYHRSSWLVAGRADPAPTSRLYTHPDTPITAEQLSKQVISFEKVKLTNNELNRHGQIVLNSMHKFQPRIHLVQVENNIKIVDDLKKFKHKTFVFPETMFNAVTAYQNQLITKLKIDSNPFAKGFRDSGKFSEEESERIEFMIESKSRLASTEQSKHIFSTVRPVQISTSKFIPEPSIVPSSLFLASQFRKAYLANEGIPPHGSFNFDDVHCTFPLLDHPYNFLSRPVHPFLNPRLSWITRTSLNSVLPSFWSHWLQLHNLHSALNYRAQGLPPEPKKTEPGKPDLSSLNS
ncbi:T-box transcription factor TBX20 [Eurytemora carolleeae]|uniref:T-box transcription factor TBX20 n=1 Tax=Eurytemora carolleeae TaxID=1294199 RepID=UPI000C77C3C8|nr:T-box transcription factor TBX20 [Eurytemora carolleeae]|eukprot:XP_023332602.1 T-box transcription factor TBX20-like [Eurytemora affinis]